MFTNRPSVRIPWFLICGQTYITELERGGRPSVLPFPTGNIVYKTHINNFSSELSIVERGQVVGHIQNRLITVSSPSVPFPRNSSLASKPLADSATVIHCKHEHIRRLASTGSANTVDDAATPRKLLYVAEPALRLFFQDVI